MHVYVCVVCAWHVVWVFHFLLSMGELTHTHSLGIQTGRTETWAVAGCVWAVPPWPQHSPVRVPRSVSHAGESPSSPFYRRDCYKLRGPRKTRRTAEFRSIWTTSELPLAYQKGGEVSREGSQDSAALSRSPLTSSVLWPRSKPTSVTGTSVIRFFFLSILSLQSDGFSKTQSQSDYKIS